MSEMLVQSMTSQLIVRFRDRILSGAYAPGSALRQDSLAAEFGTSKIPVREALVQLQSEGLVDIFPNRGFQVRPLAERGTRRGLQAAVADRTRRPWRAAPSSRALRIMPRREARSSS